MSDEFPYEMPPLPERGVPMSDWEVQKLYWRGAAEGALIKWVMKYTPFEEEKNNG